MNEVSKVTAQQHFYPKSAIASRDVSVDVMIPPNGLKSDGLVLDRPNVKGFPGFRIRDLDVLLVSSPK